MKEILLGSALLFCASPWTPAGENEAALAWKVFTAKRGSATRDPEMPSGKEDLRWVANTATLVYGKRDALLVDVFATKAETRRLVEGIRQSGKTLKYLYLTHAHADHIYGAQIVADAFPGVKVVALEPVIAGFPAQYDKEYVDGFWRKLFPGEIPETFAMPEAVRGDELEIEGHKVVVENAGFTDTGNSTFVYIPSIGLVVAGDIVYNGIHPYLKETNRDTRKEWIAALDKIQSLAPKHVVAGHKVPEYGDGPENVEATRAYIEDFERLNGKTGATLEFYDAMLELYPDRVNPGSLWGGAKAAKQKSLTK